MTTATAPLGVILDPTTLRFERTLPLPIESAWEYITRRDLLKLWLADAVIEPRVGGSVDLQFEVDPLREEKHCHSVGTVLEWNPPTRLSYTWQEELHPSSTEASFVIFELASIPEGTLLTLTHKKVDGPRIHMYLAGWHAHLDVLFARAAHVDPAAFHILFEHVLAVYEELAHGAKS